MWQPISLQPPPPLGLGDDGQIQLPSQGLVKSAPWPALLAVKKKLWHRSPRTFLDLARAGLGRCSSFQLFKIKSRWADGMEVVALQAALKQEHILQVLRFESLLAFQLCGGSLAGIRFCRPLVRNGQHLCSLLVTASAKSVICAPQWTNGIPNPDIEGLVGFLTYERFRFNLGPFNIQHPYRRL